MTPIEFKKPNILVPDPPRRINIESAGDLSTLTEDEEAYLAELILRGVVVREGAWFKIPPDPNLAKNSSIWGRTDGYETISRSRIIAAAREEGL